MKLVPVATNTDTGEIVNIDVDTLVETRAAFLATSGGGKTRFIRKIKEATHGYVQQITLDWEGDLVTVAENFDYLVAQKGGRIPVDVKSASMLARKVLELNASIIIDLSELKIGERKEWAKNFLESLVHTPKSMWNRKCLVTIDEAHELCPEKGYGQSVATDAVIDLMSLGRKRGLCGILASQRPARLHKDALTQCRNKFVGLCAWEVDRKKMASELGFTSKEKEMSLEQLDKEFYAIGPAISKTIIKVRAGSVKSRELKSGMIGEFKPMETDKAMAILAQLKDLPQQAQQEIQDMASLRMEIAQLKHKLVTGAAKPEATKLEVEQARQGGYQKGFNDGSAEVGRDLVIAKRQLVEAERKLAAIGKLIGQASVIPASRPVHVQKVPSRLPEPVISTAIPEVPNDFGKCERLILKFLSARETKSFNRAQIGAITGYSPKGGGFNNSLSKLKTADLIKQSGEQFSLNIDRLNDVVGILGADYRAPEQGSLEQWLEKLGKAPKLIYKVLLENPGQTFSKEELASRTEYAPTGGGFNNAVSQLCTLGLAVKVGNDVQLNPELLEATVG